MQNCLTLHRVFPPTWLGLFVGLAIASAVPANAATNPAALHATLSATKRVVSTDPAAPSAESWVPFTKLLPGEEVTYTITCTNSGAEPAENVVVSLPIPAETIATIPAAPQGVEVSCAIGDCTEFGQLADLRVVAPDGASRPAAPEDVRQLRWKFTQPIPPGATRTVDCRARLK